MASNSHENLTGHTAEAPAPSHRSVGLVLAAALGLVGAWPLLGENPARPWALIIAAALTALALFRPTWLKPVSWAWLGLGKVLHRIVSPVILFTLYTIAVVPTGLYLKITGKDPLRLKRDPNAKTYWINRTPPGPPSDSFVNQF